MATCTEAKWSVPHGVFYCAVDFPGITGETLTVRDIVMRPQEDAFMVEPPSCLEWPAGMRDVAEKAIIKYIKSKYTPRPCGV